jgi:hypothetical protein
MVLRLGVPARDRPRRSEAIGGDGYYGRTSRHRPNSILCTRRRCATVTSRRRRQARSGASLEVSVPFSTCRPRRVCPADASRPDHPASAFPPPARALSQSVVDGVRPCGFALEAVRVGAFRCGGRFRIRFGTARLRRPVLWCSRVRDHVHRSSDHISRRRLASACPGSGHSPRPFLARGVPDPSHPGLRDLAGRIGSSLFPSGGARGVPPFAGLLPIPRVDARTVRSAANH